MLYSARKCLRERGVEANTSDKPVPREITALLSGERLILRETNER
jgi:hypothetical protein